jgi:hypothetical protein
VKRRTTFAKAYGIRVRCHGKHVGEHNENLMNLMGTHWELRVNILGTHWELGKMTKKSSPLLSPPPPKKTKIHTQIFYLFFPIVMYNNSTFKTTCSIINSTGA